jgi:aspartyl-tRNA(Asn)/glutamyl-tRNA(Gln) amidotransferase subunit B
MIINKRLTTDLTPEKFIEEFLKLAKPVETDSNLLSETVTEVLAANQKAVGEYKTGKITVIMFLVGQVMKGMKGKADAATVRKALEGKLKA